MNEIQKVDNDTGELIPIENQSVAPLAYVGMSTNPVTEEESAILLAPPDPKDVDFRWADREQTAALAYVAHVEYRRRLNKAFRPMGWSLRIVDRRIMGDTIVVHGALYIKGCFVSEAHGEHDYNPENGNTTWATALESAKSDALVRCCKDLGMFSELWDKDYTEPLQEAWVKKNKKSCPACGKALREDKATPGSWYCWQKKGGCGWTGDPDAPKTKRGNITEERDPGAPAPAPSAVTQAKKDETKKAAPDFVGSMIAKIEGKGTIELIDAAKTAWDKFDKSKFTPDQIKQIDNAIANQKLKLLNEAEANAPIEDAVFDDPAGALDARLNDHSDDPPFIDIDEIRERIYKATSLEEIKTLRRSFAFHATKFDSKKVKAYAVEFNKVQAEFEKGQAE